MGAIQPHAAENGYRFAVSSYSALVSYRQKLNKLSPSFLILEAAICPASRALLLYYPTALSLCPHPYRWSISNNATTIAMPRTTGRVHFPRPDAVETNTTGVPLLLPESTPQLTSCSSDA